MHNAIIHIGSNLGNRKSFLSKCRFLLREKVGTILKSSSIYTTEAWGLKGQKEFLNQAFQMETELSLHELLKTCQEIENLLFRQREIPWGPRTIDIDIIFYDNEVTEDENVIIPHPRMHERNFVLHPLAEIVPEYVHPILKQSILQLKQNSKDPSYVSL
ncbi:2-amino-4-hydroxy-6-hydroxymethyldihydropteridine diphosphokinase [Portibacter marinus]|uniref:2-amino-4-hydroxy-6- hydroxymethyldihydropteridine diphosphokinase n=1 Tax=Portibacter marinus TaxID=2898660 RepID=UPI001F46CBED|nr:2-amino-4-hydroxy-6-hydroxymethyldihydropteridine diphosphokinase [Portibacter marinus]